MELVFEIASWLALIALTAVAIPQLILNYKRKSVEGVSWPMFGLLFFGLAVYFIRSIFTDADFLFKLNYGFGALIALAANIQIFHYWQRGRNK